MLTKTAEKFFGGKRIDVARVLRPTWSASAVYLWDRTIPLAAARKLSELSGGQLQVVESLYDQQGNIIKAKHKKRA